MRSRSRKERRSRHKSHTTHSSHLSCTYSIHLSPPILFAAFDVSIFRLKFGDQIMTPMRDVFGIHTDELLDFGLMRRIADSGHTRIPVLTAAGAVGSAAVRAELTAGSLAHCSPISPPISHSPFFPCITGCIFTERSVSHCSLSLQPLSAASHCSLSLQPLIAASRCGLSLQSLTAPISPTTCHASPFFALSTHFPDRSLRFVCSLKFDKTQGFCRPRTSS